MGRKCLEFGSSDSFFFPVDGLIMVVYQDDGSGGHPVLGKGLRIFLVDEVTLSADRQM